MIAKDYFLAKDPNRIAAPILRDHGLASDSASHRADAGGPMLGPWSR
jgi:hypothetical protein